MNNVSGFVDTKVGRIDRKIYVDRDIYDQELEQVFGRCWLFIGHESQVSKPNDFAAAYMGEDPILLTRDSKGKLHGFLNMCRHRGNRICRADAGNAPSFMCTYHGWTFATDGKLVGVPGYKEAYFEELDRSQWGLVEAPHCESYKGLVFATWDKDAPSLRDYMGDMAWWLDMLVDRREGGTVVLDGIHKWVINANWKFGAENFAGDGYHFPITHGSTFMRPGQPSSSGGTNRAFNIFSGNRHPISPGKGNGVLMTYDGPGPNPNLESQNPILKSYMVQHLPELEKRLGPARAKQAIINVANMFPNFTWHPAPIIRMWHPRGPGQTEMWSYCIVDKAADEQMRQFLRRNVAISFGPAGATEQDDMNNFIQCTATARTMAGRKYQMNVQLGVGKDAKSEVMPGVISPSPSETNQRSFYARWAEVMDAPSWKQISVEKASFKEPSAVN